MRTLTEGEEVQPPSLVTVKLYVPFASPAMVFETVFPAIFPGLMTQFPAGNPERVTEPVVIAQVG